LKRNRYATTRSHWLYSFSYHSPADRDLIVEGSETRRKFMDSVIQLIPIIYSNSFNIKSMSQRNALLKYFALNHVLIPIHSIYNEQLNGFGAYIFEKRKEFINQFILFSTRIIKP
jgi:DNA replication and repair protein RecF